MPNVRVFMLVHRKMCSLSIKQWPTFCLKGSFVACLCYAALHLRARVAQIVAFIHFWSLLFMSSPAGGGTLFTFSSHGPVPIWIIILAQTMFFSSDFLSNKQHYWKGKLASKNTMLGHSENQKVKTTRKQEGHKKWEFLQKSHFYLFSLLN